MDDHNNAKASNYWDSAANKQKIVGISQTHSDKLLPLLETNAIAVNLSSNENVVDIGCGACDNSIKYMNICNSYVGVELIDTFVRLSLEKIAENKITNSKILKFDGLEYVKENELNYDSLITQRFIINLKDRASQLSFFSEIKNNNKNKNLKLILCEGFEEELNNLNTLRSIIGLDPIKVAHYNNFLDNKFIKDVTDLGFYLVKEFTFNSFFLLSRLFNNEKFAKNNIDIAKAAYDIENSNLLKIANNISYSKVIILKIRA